MLEHSKVLKMAESADMTDLSVDEVTSYGIAKFINECLAKAGIPVDKPVTPQMMYSYGKSGRINGQKGTKRFTSAEVEAFAAKFVAKIINQAKPSQIRIQGSIPAQTPVNPDTSGQKRK